MARIRLLSEDVSHKIAAGEVVERPASVVKELVENALDAQATRIDVRIHDGGQELIQVSDDGIGIAEEDLERAFMRHATSKISSADDLFAIQSLGFRGEALPSIASVSQLILTTRTADAASAHRVTASEGRLDIVPAGSRQGTTVEVRRLFYNTPARYKFLKAAATERREIGELVTKFSMAHPNVAFSLWADDKQVLQTTGSGSQLDAVAACHGWSHAKQLLSLESKTHWGTMRGYVSPPSLTKGNRRDQLLILNGRIIQAPTLIYAAERAYQGMLPQRRFPFLILTLRMDPTLVDVNVHPAKSEVRFQQERDIGSDVHRAVRDTLLANDLSPRLQEQQRPAPSAADWRDSAQTRTGGSGVQQGSFKFDRSPSAGNSQLWTPNSWEAVDSLLQEHAPQYDPAKVRPPLGGQPKKDHGHLEAGQSPAAQDPSAQTPTPHTSQSQPSFGHSDGRGSHKLRDQLLNGRIIGQLHQSFVLLETSEGLWILDQHIIHERLLYERFLKTEEKRPPVQQILPQSLEFSLSESDGIRQHLDFLASLGIELEEFGPQTFLLRGIPQELSQNSGHWQQDILRIVESREQQENWREQAAITMACRGAIKAGDYLDQRQIKQLLTQLAEADNPFTCPHGRPILVRLDRSELLRRFGRT